jgi:hypothetical protein
MLALGMLPLDIQLGGGSRPPALSSYAGVVSLYNEQ